MSDIENESEEIIVLDVIDEEGWCHVLNKGQKSVMQLDKDVLKNCGFKPSNNSNSVSESENKSVLEWSQNDTKLLLDLYSEYLKDVGPMKRFKNKKSMWTKISEEILETLNLLRTPTQCESRYKTVLKRKTAAVTKNRQTGESPEPVEYHSEIEKIKLLDDSLEPEVLYGVGKSTQSKVKKTDSDTYNEKKIESLSTVLYKIHKEKEVSKNLRHQKN